jgi:hypothetical protein
MVQYHYYRFQWYNFPVRWYRWYFFDGTLTLPLEWYNYQYHFDGTILITISMVLIPFQWYHFDTWDCNCTIQRVMVMVPSQIVNDNGNIKLVMVMVPSEW